VPPDSAHDVVKKRPVGELEGLVILLNKTGEGNNIVSLVSIESPCSAPLEENHVRSALDLLQQRHPLLRARIQGADSETPTWVCDAPPIPLEVVPRTSANAWEAATQPLLSHKYDMDVGPPILAVLLKDEKGKRDGCLHYDMLLALSHAICDARSVREACYEFMVFLEQLRGADAAGMNLHLSCPSLPMPPTLESAAEAAVSLAKSSEPPASQEGVPAQSPPATLPSEIAEEKWSSLLHLPLTLRKARSMSLTISSQKATALLDHCRREKTTIHGALCAAGAIAAAKLRASHKLPAQDVTVQSVIDLRPRLPNPIGNSTVGKYVGGIAGGSAFAYELDDFWSTARKAKKDLTTSLEDGSVWRGTTNVGGIKEGWSMGALVGACFGSVLISNVGGEAYRKGFGDLQWTRFSYAFGTPLRCGPFVQVTCSGFAGDLHLAFLWVEPCCSEGIIEDFACRFVQELDRSMVLSLDGEGYGESEIFA